MIPIILLCLAVSIDAMSFGLAQGLKKIKLPHFIILIMTILSTILFSIPLLLSSILASICNKVILNIINGIILIILGYFYLILFVVRINCNSRNKAKSEKIESNSLLRSSIIATFPISTDAMFTALLNGYSFFSLLFGIISYLIITYLSIYISNRISFKISSSTHINLEIICSILFILLGFLKIFGI